MNQTRINILCILIICIMAASMILPIYFIGMSFGSGFSKGFAMGSDDAEVELYSNHTPVDLSFSVAPSEYGVMPDTLVTDDGQRLPMMLDRATVLIPDSTRSDALEWMIIGCYAAGVILFVCFVVAFVKFIININKGRIFVRKNIGLLRRIAWYLISVALLRCAGGIADDTMLSNMPVKLGAYEVTTYWTLPWSVLIIGLISLLMAEIWARGLQMREEQELTI